MFSDWAHLASPVDDIFLCSLLFCSVFMGICVWGVQLHWLQADTYGPSGVIQETIERHEDGQGWGEGELGKCTHRP